MPIQSDRVNRNNAACNDMEYQMANVQLESRPTWMQIEPTVVCNLHCRMCREKHHNAEPGREASPGLFEAIRASGWLATLNLIEINGWGETFVHRGVGDFLDECAKHPDLTVSITTNGLLLGEDTLLASMCALPRMRLVFSIDSPDAADYEYIRRGASFRRLTDNLDRLNQWRDRTRSAMEMECHCLVNRLNLKRLRAMVDFAQRHAFSKLVFIKLHNFPELEVGDDEAVPMIRDAIDYARASGQRCEGYTANGADEPEAARPDHVWRCPRPWKHVQVLSDGDIVPCCYLSSPSSDAVMGNLLTTPLDEIWNNARYQTLRRAAYRDFPSFCALESGGCAAKTSRKPNVRVT